MLLYGICLATIAGSHSSRTSFYSGLAIGLAVASIQLQFLARIFGISAIVLWLIFSLWIAMFLLAARNTVRANRWAAAWLPGILWIGFEYFRSELYALRFSWVTPGLALVDSPWANVLQGGQYLASGLLIGGGFAVHRDRVRGSLCCLAAVVAAVFMPVGTDDSLRQIELAGIQLEHPEQSTLPLFLNELDAAAPSADLLVLSEYTLDGPVPPEILDWCDDHDRTVVLGGKDVLDNGQFYNTVFVVGPQGSLVHKQVKSVPIQFFADGLPAESETTWSLDGTSTGFPICYDMSYTRVIDQYIDAGARLLVNPTMDPEHWGAAEHWLHARIPKCRAIEYGLPIFRLASSGVSVAVSADGRTLATGSYPGQREIVTAELAIPASVRKPPSWWLGPLCVAITIGWSLTRWVGEFLQRRRHRAENANQPASP